MESTGACKQEISDEQKSSGVLSGDGRVKVSDVDKAVKRGEGNMGEIRS